jgi:hypothetical protein
VIGERRRGGALDPWMTRSISSSANSWLSPNGSITDGSGDVAGTAPLSIARLQNAFTCSTTIGGSGMAIHTMARINASGLQC